MSIRDAVIAVKQGLTIEEASARFGIKPGSIERCIDREMRADLTRWRALGHKKRA